MYWFLKSVLPLELQSWENALGKHIYHSECELENS